MSEQKTHAVGCGTQAPNSCFMLLSVAYFRKTSKKITNGMRDLSTPGLLTLVLSTKIPYAK